MLKGERVVPILKVIVLNPSSGNLTGSEIANLNCNADFDHVDSLICFTRILFLHANIHAARVLTLSVGEQDTTSLK